MNSVKQKECIELSEEIIKNFEMSDIPTKNIVLKCLRLCRLTNDADGILLFTYESAGYPSLNGLLGKIAWRIAAYSGRIYFNSVKNKDGTENKQSNLFSTLLGTLEETIEAQKIHLSAASDPNISISSSNPNQFVQLPISNSYERNAVSSSITNYEAWRSKIRGSLYNYILRLYITIKYGNIINDCFTESQRKVNEKLINVCPESLKRFISAYDNMNSDNPEDWANAVHSCRRILCDLANVLYPPSKTPIEENGQLIPVEEKNYKNRLLQFIKQKSNSKAYKFIVGNELDSISKRLDAIIYSVNKGTHSDISKDEAARYIIHTYILINDILSLIE